MEKIIVEIEGNKFETTEKLTLGQIQYLAGVLRTLLSDSVALSENMGFDFILKMYELGLVGKIIAGILIPAGGKFNETSLKYLESKVSELDGEIQKRIVEYFFQNTLKQAINYIPFFPVNQGAVGQ